MLTLLPIMGTALINANKLDSGNPVKGAILTVSTDNASRVSTSFSRMLAGDSGRFTVLDWVHATSPTIDDIFARSGVGREPAETEKAVRQYIADQSPPVPLIEGTSVSNNIR